ncbi:carbohydrate ABC transporter permease [Streptomyces sp. PTY087I2]|uniref:carbohydrate ABC transporter permease n=1 Tax=Streptomyces sp. PTY087I2 TaxID=1819298 RepID=UPI00080B4B27|nr:sugar ABC transporter permease [Streptomyces sp. PTY087I2]OCC08013.1 Lactose transport system permease protein LacF [Streptomyces sp. PTY087I2]
MSSSVEQRRPPLPGAPASPGPQPARPVAVKRPARRLREKLAGAGFLAPAVVLVSALLLLPFATTVHRSFYDDRRVSGFAGLDNYALFLNDPVLTRSIQNTLMWVVGTVALPLLLGLAIAVLTHSGGWSRVARLVVVLPYALSGSAVAVVWNFVLNTDGAANQALRAFGLDSLAQGWLLEWPGNTLVMIVANTWQSAGVAVILFLVGLQTIPPETLEAASLDGAAGWRKFVYVVLPQLRTVSVIVVGTSLVNGLKSFDLIWVLTQGGPGRQSETLAVSMYQETFLALHPGAGAAVAVVLTTIVLIASWLYLRRQLTPKGN